MALVLALGALGVGFAHWVDQVVVTEIVGTGDVCVEFQYPVTVTDTHAPPPYYVGPPTTPPAPPTNGDWTCDPGTMANVRQLDKDVGWGQAWLEDTDEDGSDDTLWVTLNNVYPCYYNHIDFWVTNCGTIPVIMESLELFDGTTTTTITSGGIYQLDLNNNGYPDFEIKWGNHLGSQLDPGPQFDWDLSYGMHFIQDDFGPNMQGQSYTFSIKLNFVQWNKYTPPAP